MDYKKELRSAVGIEKYAVFVGMVLTIYKLYKRLNSLEEIGKVCTAWNELEEEKDLEKEVAKAKAQPLK